jgi:segregation and condensation protein B
VVVSRDGALRLRRGQSLILRGRDAPIEGGPVYAACAGVVIAVGSVERGGRYLFQTAPDCAEVLEHARETPKKLSRAALETLAIIAYHEPVTRAEIEDIRGVAVSGGTLDTLMEAGWVRPAGRRESPGRPIQFATTATFLAHFSLSSRRDLPGLADLKSAGLLDAAQPSDSPEANPLASECPTP